MVRVGVVGATGYAGAELVRILAGHPRVTLSTLVSRQYADVPFDAVYPALTGLVDTACTSLSVEAVCETADLIFLALPHKVPMSIVPELMRQGKRVIDLSADFRFRNAAAYEAFYQPHTAPELLARAVYGLSEINRDAICGADLIGNPGCYPTSILLPLVPLAREKLIQASGIVADSKSGVSGAGRTAAVASLYCEITESFKAYKVADHRHNPEIDEVLGRAFQQQVHLTFVPHLVPMSRGMLSTVYATLADGVDTRQVADCLAAQYDASPFVRLLPEDRLPETRFVRGTNYCDIAFRIDADNRRLILVSAIDNLVKGAAGQAVQNMNLMLGWEETLGLDGLPFPV